MEKNEKRVKIAGDDHRRYERDSYGNLYLMIAKKAKEEGTIYDEETAISNHTPILKNYLIKDNGCEVTEVLVFEVRRAGRMWGDFTITAKDMLSTTAPNLPFGAACRINIGRGLKAFYSEAMQMQCEDAPVKTLYQHTGYTEIDGELVFLNGDFSVTKDGLTDKYSVELPENLSGFRFLNEKDPGRYNTLLSQLEDSFPAPMELMFPLVALAFLTALNGLLRDVKLEPRFILYVIGKTGSCKTSASNYNLNYFGSFPYNAVATSNFSSTANANEKLYAITDSVLMLLDDRIPSTTADTRRRMENIEQIVLRNFGDKAARLRLNADSTHKVAYRPKCNLIITAEEAYSNVGESGIARTIAVELKPGDIRLDGDNSFVEKYRLTPHLNQCMSEFIQWVICNYDELKRRVVDLFDTINPHARSGGHGRQAETITHLEMGIVIMCDWLQSAEIITEKQAECIQHKAWDIFKRLADKQNRRIKEENPVQLFLSAVRAMLDRNSIKVVRIGQDSDYTAPSKVGFRDENYYYFDPQGIYVKVKEFYALQDRTFPLSQSALFSHLANDKLIEVDVAKDGKTQSTKAKRIKGVAEGRKVRYLWLRASALDDEKEDS